MATADCCTQTKESSDYPSDFRFKIKRESFEYDSESQNYIYYDKSIVVPLTRKELQIIYEYARDIIYLTFPKEFECDGKSSMMPCFEDRLEIRYNNLYKYSVNSDCCSKIEKKRPELFDHLVRKITDILDSKDQVKNLPKYDIIYM